MSVDRLEQDAADTLQSHEQQREWRARAIADRDKANAPAPNATWAPVYSEQQRQAFKRYSEKHNLPF